MTAQINLLEETISEKDKKVERLSNGIRTFRNETNKFKQEADNAKAIGIFMTFQGLLFYEIFSP